MTRGRCWLALPLRWRLTILMTAVLAAVLLLFSLVFAHVLQSALMANTAQSLYVSASGAINERLNAPKVVKAPRNGESLPVPAPEESGLSPGTPTAAVDPKLLADLAKFLTTRDTAARTTDTLGETTGDGPSLAGITTISAPMLDPSLYRTVADQRRERYFRDPAPNGPLLVELVPLTHAGTPDQVVGVLELTTSLQGVDRLLDHLRLLLMTGTILATLLSLGITVSLLRGALQPLQRLVAASRVIALGDLSQRVAVPSGDDELTDLAHAFNEMVSRLDVAFATQRRFIGDASHELRTPLTALSGGVEMLLLGVDGADPATRPRLLHLMEGEIARMGRLVDGLLTLTRFDADPLGALRLAPVDLSALLGQVAEETRLLAPDRTVLLESSAAEPVHILGDADRLRQALLNLCANARAHTLPDDTIHLLARRVGLQAEVVVADNGEGIAAADLPHIWDRFYRADPARARRGGQGGLGLGLAIVRAIVEAHRGTVTLSSTLHVGTTVTLALPAADCTAGPQQLPSSGVPV